MWQTWVATWLWHSCKSTQIARQICHKSVSFAQILISPNVKCTLTDTQTHRIFWWGLRKMGKREIGKGGRKMAMSMRLPNTSTPGKSDKVGQWVTGRLQNWKYDNRGSDPPIFGKNPLRCLGRPYSQPAPAIHNFPTFPSFRPGQKLFDSQSKLSPMISESSIPSPESDFDSDPIHLTSRQLNIFRWHFN